MDVCGEGMWVDRKERTYVFGGGFNAIVVDAFGRHASTTAEYLDFYRRIFPVARYLLTKATPDVTEREVTKYLVGVVDPSFHPRIMAHLEWKHL